ncbi:MAG: hypothetical protein K6F35_08505 [Lachnospiraceae bacterium]|nr:hypothetical protein [Lachnospiraceae bacterium]
MEIIGRRKSLTACTESGWDAYDLLTAEPLSDEDIELFREIGGSFLYLKQLKRPFFKVESHSYVIRGSKGESFFRFAAHRESLHEIDRAARLLSPGWQGSWNDKFT